MPPDYRSDRMDSIEGRGNARSLWFEWLSEHSDDDAANLVDMPQVTVFRSGPGHGDEPPEPVSAKERSELLGFWITWHLAGGFRRLESWGWHRTTIHRKIRRFRDAFNGAHPDEFKFDWILLDLGRSWDESADIFLDYLHEGNGYRDIEDLLEPPQGPEGDHG